LAGTPPNLDSGRNVNGQANHLHPDQADDFGIIRDQPTTLPYNAPSHASATAKGSLK